VTPRFSGAPEAKSGTHDDQRRSAKPQVNSYFDVSARAGS
jgi:hypothetical protein